MRIISGKWKGRLLTGSLPDSVRPTTDSLRESIFNILNNYIDFENISVADIFAGSGALGLEAMSRGASNIIFIESNSKTASLIEKNCKNFNLTEDEYEIIINEAASSMNILKALKCRFDLVFLDPPYYKNLIMPVILNLISNNLLNNNSIIVAEYGSSEGLELPQNLVSLKEKTYGSSKVNFLEYNS